MLFDLSDCVIRESSFNNYDLTNFIRENIANCTLWCKLTSFDDVTNTSILGNMKFGKCKIHDDGSITTSTPSFYGSLPLVLHISDNDKAMMFKLSFALKSFEYDELLLNNFR